MKIGKKKAVDRWRIRQIKRMLISQLYDHGKSFLHTLFYYDFQRVHLKLSHLVGGFNPSEKYESQLGSFSQYMEKNVPNHQPEYFTNLNSLRPWMGMISLK